MSQTARQVRELRHLERDGRDIRGQILDAALSAFNDFGLRHTTMEDIARRAGVARMTVYRRFASKDDLVKALMLCEAARFFDALAERLDLHESPADRVAEGFAFGVDYLRRHALLNRLLTTEPDSLLPYLTTEAGPILDAARSFIATRLDVHPGDSEHSDSEHSSDVQAGAEVLVRLALSFVLTRESAVEDLRGFARRHLSPLLLSASAGKHAERERGRDG